MRPPETDVTRLRWMIHDHSCNAVIPGPLRAIVTLAARLTHRIWFVYWDENTQRHRLFFARADYRP